MDSIYLQMLRYWRKQMEPINEMRRRNDREFRRMLERAHVKLHKRRGKYHG